MPDLYTQFLLVGKLFILMGIGFLLRKRNVITDEGNRLLTDLMIDLILPCSIISSFLTDLTAEQLRQAVEIFLLSVGIQIFSFLLGLIAYRHCRPEHQAVMQYGTVCSNSGILGTPVTEGLFGPEGTFLAAIFLIPLRVVMWTLGLSFFSRRAGKFSLKRILTHPCIAAVLIGLVLMLTGLPVPVLFMDSLKAIGGCNTALAMMLVGSIAADMAPRLLLSLDALYFSMIRLAIMPLLVLGACVSLGAAAMTRNIAVILTAMPAGSTTSVLALKYGGDAPFASACTTLTTVLSLLAVPLWCAILL